MKIYIRIFYLILWTLFPSFLHAYNLKQINSRNGLSNSSVFCLFQDNQRFLWLGTYDGLNMYDGRDIHIYKPDINNRNSLSSNIIRSLIETDGRYLWVGTKWGLNKLSRYDNTIEEYYTEFKENSHLAKDSKENLYVFGKRGILSLYDKEQKCFIDLDLGEDISNHSLTGFFIDRNDTVYIASQGSVRRYTVKTLDSGEITLIQHPNLPHPLPVTDIFMDDDTILLLDQKNNLYIYKDNHPVFLKNLSSLIQENGFVSSIIYKDETVFIAFRTNGVFSLERSKSYHPERIDINCGVFCLWKDESQDIVWIGTDGQGIYAWTKDEYTFRTITLEQLSLVKERPVRAIITDHEDNLWMGTKENGVIQIKDYRTGKELSDERIRHFTTQDYLSNNAVFAFALNRNDQTLWIGSDGPGVDYYSYMDKKIHPLVNQTGERITQVHAMLAIEDTLLWVGSGSSVLKIHLQKKGNAYEANQINRFSFDDLYQGVAAQVYSLYRDNDSILWIGTRGNGLIRLNTQTDSYSAIKFDQDGIVPMNDILSIHKDLNGHLWLGCSYGLTRLDFNPDGSYSYKNYSENDGLPNSTIHGILDAGDRSLWLSSNTGIILFDPVQETFRNYNQKSGLKVIEYCDNAYYKDTLSDICFFGGVDGLTYITSGNDSSKEFIPSIYFTGLRIFNEEHPLSGFESRKGGERFIQLSHKQNFFSVSFIAMDFINGENNTYSYKLENFSDVWMNTGTNEAQFTNIPPGDYVLKVKYNDNLLYGHDSYASLNIRILPPWYQTFYAKILYVLLLVAAICMVILLIRRRYEKRRMEMARQLNEKYKEEMYESKLRFFTNITHEFCTPLTLIYGPCERILSHERSDRFIKKYVHIIKSNTERLNHLIQEVIDFRRIETGNQTCHIHTYNISELVEQIGASFIELSEQNHIDFRIQASKDITWNTDHSCFTKILNNLISNAFKYTPQQGNISVTVSAGHEELLLKVYNTGKGIAPEDIPLVFNRYTVLDNIKENEIKGLSSRNGLGLAICKTMTEILNGTIELDSKRDEYTCFTVKLPFIQNTDDNVAMTAEIPSIPFVRDENVLKEELPDIKENSNAVKPSVLVIDDNKELLWMIKDILSEDYNVTTAEDGEKGLQMIANQTPHLIITDIMMPNMDGISLTKQIRNNKHTMHIPLIVLSAKNATGEKIEGFESGADAYVTKPFDPAYLKAVIRNQIRNRKVREEYYHTSASAYDFANGQLLAKEDKDFLHTAIKVIDENINNTGFTPVELAASLQVSIRNLYRKFKELEQPSPKDFIKEQRINYAARLLITSRLTIQEIMDQTGFTNRSHFNKEFTKRYNQTPREYREVNQLKDKILK